MLILRIVPRGGTSGTPGPTPSSRGPALARGGAIVDVRMRRGRRADLTILWQATLQTVWDDIPSDERDRLDRTKWEAHFRKKIEPYLEGDRTEKWIAEGPAGEFLGYLILGESGFLTPEPHGFIYDIWVAPTERGKGVGKFLVEWACEWARKRGHRKVKLEVAEANQRARRVYESGGFRTERRYMGKVLD